ncbi:hypothetical protein GVN21_18220 [Caulobacter sp. SLTY]|uniref:hypothetical protein n=1 Tax=Caulobacter sp. SLTY TaxID=2683262 RepID=UPI0014128208|nr:hypothetical protein [Caulobacter sp. SLTY]NBB17303.1 hypothetical protein [Caulobacter sp. SLTY]
MSGPDPTHLYDAVSDQKTKIVDGFAEQRVALKRAVEDQRLAAMPEHMRQAALGPAGQVSVEIVQILQQIIAREVTRQLEMAITAMIAQANAAKSDAAPEAVGRTSGVN